MNSQINTSLVIRSSLALAFAMAIWFPAQVLAAEPAMTDAKMMGCCNHMMAQKQKLADDGKAQDAELKEQLAKVSGAPDDKKAPMMLLVITKMADQHCAMCARKEAMDGEMMQHMMQHVQMGKESVSHCPMMKGMDGMKCMMDEKTGDAKETK